MNISDCIDNENIGGCKTKQLTANTLDEQHLLDTVIRLLYETKSVKKSTDKIELLLNKNNPYKITFKIDSQENADNYKKLFNTKL